MDSQAVSRGSRSFYKAGTNDATNQELIAAVTGKTPVITSIVFSGSAAGTAAIETSTPTANAQLTLGGAGTVGVSDTYVQGVVSLNVQADVVLTGNWFIWGSYFYK